MSGRGCLAPDFIGAFLHCSLAWLGPLQMSVFQICTYYLLVWVPDLFVLVRFGFFGGKVSGNQVSFEMWDFRKMIF